MFVPHAESLGFALSPEQLRSDLSLPRQHPDRPHPALLHTVFLWSLRVSGSQDLARHGNLYVQRSILALQDALRQDPSLEVGSFFYPSR